jgi:glucan-binding YG repeat protein
MRWELGYNRSRVVLGIHSRLPGWYDENWMKSNSDMELGPVNFSVWYFLDSSNGPQKTSLLYTLQNISNSSM